MNNKKNYSQNSDPKVIVIFPAKNEEGTIEKAISTAKQSYYKPEILVVDAYSTDKTTEGGAVVTPNPNSATESFYCDSCQKKHDYVAQCPQRVFGDGDKWCDKCQRVQ